MWTEVNNRGDQSGYRIPHPSRGGGRGQLRIDGEGDAHRGTFKKYHLQIGGAQKQPQTHFHTLSHIPPKKKTGSKQTLQEPPVLCEDVATPRRKHAHELMCKQIVSQGLHFINDNLPRQSAKTTRPFRRGGVWDAQMGRMWSSRGSVNGCHSGGRCRRAAGQRDIIRVMRLHSEDRGGRNSEYTTQQCGFIERT